MRLWGSSQNTGAVVDYRYAQTNNNGKEITPATTDTLKAKSQDSWYNPASGIVEGSSENREYERFKYDANAHLRKRLSFQLISHGSIIMANTFLSGQDFRSFKPKMRFVIQGKSEKLENIILSLPLVIFI